MALTPNSRLGVYEVAASIGEGGMGQVFRATDTKLKRQVAIKVLPSSLAADHDRLARFQREAEVLAALNHPNIAAIFGLEESDGVSAIVMELVEGEDLSQRIARGAIPIDEALPIARQIAEALEAAHEQNIIHRDLKPANIKVRADGTVKVLDFGLAKPSAATADSSSASIQPTLTTPAMTQAGMILGTAAYMSPEQARGTAVDKRADLWAFGVVLWEMLTGARLFNGPTVSDTLAAVLRAEPDWTALGADTPAPIRRLLRRCLEKDRKRRLDSAAAARLEIDEAISAPSAAETAGASTPLAPRSVWSRVMPWAWAASTLGLALAVVLMWAPWRASPSSRGAELRFMPFAFEQGGQTAAVWSPDGKALAFGARQKATDPFQIYVRYLDSAIATPITHLAAGGTPVQWTTTGRIVFRTTQTPAGLWSVSPVGGEPEPLHAFDQARTSAAFVAVGTASVSLDGTTVAWLHTQDDGVQTVWTSSPPGAAPRRYEPAPFATKDIYNAPTLKFSPDGKQILLILNGGAGEQSWLMPYPPDAANPPRRVLSALPAARGTPRFSWMPDNRHVVASTTAGAQPYQLYMADTVSGSWTVFSGGTTAQTSPAVSPDGSRLVFLESTTDHDIVSVNLLTASVSPLITTQRSEDMPAWAARQAALVYVTNRNGRPEIWLHKPGQPDRPLVTARDFPAIATSFMSPVLSPDATRVIYGGINPDSNIRLWMSAVVGSAPVPLLKGAEDYSGSWSPDGNWFVYWHSADGRTSVRKVKTTGQAEPEVLRADVSQTEAWLPVWSPSGEWILYEDAGVKLMTPDGKTTRELSSKTALTYAFSTDGQTIYGLRGSATTTVELFSMNVSGGAEKTIAMLGPEHLPSNSLGPTLRLTLTPDGKSLTYSTRKITANLWLIEGLNTVMPDDGHD